MAEEEARRACLAAGATRDSVRQRGAVVERSETPLPYMAPDAVRIRVRVVGELDLSGKSKTTTVYTAKTAKAKQEAEAKAKAKAEAAEPEGERVLLPMPGKREPAIATEEPSPAAELQVAADASKTIVDANGDWCAMSFSHHRFH